MLTQLIKGLDGNVWNTRIASLESIEKVFAKCETGIEGSIKEETLLAVIAGLGATMTDGKVCCSFGQIIIAHLTANL